MKEILGNNLENLFKTTTKGEMTYKGKKYEVWEISDDDYKKMCDMTEEEFSRLCPEGWWRSANGSVLGAPSSEYEINGIPIIAWDGETRKDWSENCEDCSDKEDCAYASPAECFGERKYSSLTEYFYDELSVSTEKNITALAVDLAKHNGITMGELFSKYEGGTSMNFGKAIEALKEGKKVARKGWNGKGMHLFLLHGKTIQSRVTECYGNGVAEETPVITDSICMYTAQKTVVVGWLASQTDMLAEDWVILD